MSLCVGIYAWGIATHFDWIEVLEADWKVTCTGWVSNCQKLVRGGKCGRAHFLPFYSRILNQTRHSRCFCDCFADSCDAGVVVSYGRKLCGGRKGALHWMKGSSALMVSDGPGRKFLVLGLEIEQCWARSRNHQILVDADHARLSNSRFPRWDGNLVFVMKDPA